MNYPIWKRLFDFTLALLGIFILFPLMIILYLASSVDVRHSGLFIQNRIGQFGKTFVLYKFQSINPKSKHISAYGKFIRKYKLDELPQLFNILKGDMSFVGPRPDIAGYYDVLQGENREVLQLKPGLTSDASIKYRNEDDLLSQQNNPDFYNDEVLFPDKVAMNMNYMKNMSFGNDIKIIVRTIISIFD